jgi:hypothetical protein
MGREEHWKNDAGRQGIEHREGSRREKDRTERRIEKREGSRREKDRAERTGTFGRGAAAIRRVEPQNLKSPAALLRAA